MADLTRRQILGAGAVIAGGTGLASATALDDGCHAPGPDARHSIRPATGAPITASWEADTEKPYEQYDEYSYDPSTNTVRYDSGAGHDTVPWGEFLTGTATATARDAARERVRSSLGNEIPQVEASVPDGYTPYPVAVSLVTETEEGCVVATPGVDYETVRSVAPTSVTVTVAVEEKSATRDLAVGVEKTVRERVEPA